ncbi:AAA-ATPase At5g57480-like [Benincasa hispida]|uniref:AAA-ATPase At5g57480-like n=1 Tax=Benincasa hispida TaxID=102211 RepID=UPI001900A1BE|nr:AAA-ATPase At5g57480-like [Benincasa hispida]
MNLFTTYSNYLLYGLWGIFFPLQFPLLILRFFLELSLSLFLFLHQNFYVSKQSSLSSTQNKKKKMEYWSTMASLLGLIAFLQSLFPPILTFSTAIFSSFSSYIYFDIPDIDGFNTNELYTAVQLYLTSSLSAASANPTTRLSLTRPLNSTALTFTLQNNASISDEFNGVSLQWHHIVTPRQLHNTFPWRIFPEHKRKFTLKFKKQHKSLILNSYFDHILEKANELRRRNQDRYLFTNPRGGGDSLRGCNNPWVAVPFKHPSTFETLAIDPIKKQEIMEDLQDFAKNGKLFYQRTGRAWNRGYLLYGPPGTGKSSLIAAMANFLGFDMYDLELTEVQNNSELKTLLMKTTAKSIVVIEDIDCSLNLSNRKNSRNDSITLSGLLNFIDGLWSCCGSEKIFVFTTNHIEKLDPALVRSGRMDMHIFMSFCSFAALKILLRNYLDWDEEEEDWDGSVLKEMEQSIEKAEMSAADICEILIKNRREKGRAMRRVLEALKMRGKKKVAINGASRKEDQNEECEKKGLKDTLKL